MHPLRGGHVQGLSLNLRLNLLNRVNRVKCIIVGIKTTVLNRGHVRYDSIACA